MKLVIADVDPADAIAKKEEDERQTTSTAITRSGTVACRHAT